MLWIIRINRLALLEAWHDFLTTSRAADIRVRSVCVSDDELCVGLMDGRTITVPLAWYPRLLDASPAQRAQWELAGAGFGIHWPGLDEDLSTEGLLRGAPAALRPPTSGQPASE